MTKEKTPTVKTVFVYKDGTNIFCLDKESKKFELIGKGTTAKEIAELTGGTYLGK